MDKKNRTIDGLVIRGGATPRRQLGFPDKKVERARRVKAVEGEVEGREKVVAAEKVRKTPTKVDKRAAAIESFLEDVRDEDPTSLVEYRDRAQGRDEDEGERPEKKRRRGLKWAFLVPIIILFLAIVAILFVVELGFWDVQAQLAGGDLGIPVVLGAALSIVWNIGELAIVRWVVLLMILGLLGLAIWNGRKVGRVRKGIVIGVGSLVVIAVLVGVSVWKGVSVWNQLNDALGAMTGGKVSIGRIQEADPTIPFAEDVNGRTNILVFGTSGYGMDDVERGDSDLFSDSMMVVSLDQDEGDVKTVSLPRDLVVRDKYRCSSRGGLNEVYYCEYKKYKQDIRYGSVRNNAAELSKLRWDYEERATKKLMEAVAEITGLEMHYWAHANWGALVTVVDAVGGIDLAIEYQGNKDDYRGSLPVIWTTDKRGIKENTFTFKAGTEVHLDGRTALELARARNYRAGLYGASGSNWNREKNQQAILAAVLEKAKKTNFVKDLDAALGIVGALGDNLRMGFDAEGIRRGIHLAGMLGVDNWLSIDISMMFSTGNLLGGRDGQSCVPSEVSGCYNYAWPRAGFYNYSAISTLIANKLKSGPFEMEGAVVDVLNGTEQTGLAKQVSDEMKKSGYKIGAVGNAPAGTTYEKTVIYRMEGADKPATEKQLAEKFGGEVKSGGLPEGVSSTADFVVILGEDAVPQP